jgi:hypothetical protein
MHRLAIGSLLASTAAITGVAVGSAVAGASPALSAPVITSTSGQMVVGKNRTITIRATGYPKPTFTEKGALPPGIAFVPSIGEAELTGTPAPGAGKLYTITITATNTTGHDTVPYRLTVEQIPSFPSGFCPPTLTVGQYSHVSQSVTAWPSSFGLTLTSSLPSGLQFEQNPTNDVVGVLSGTPGPGTGGKTTLHYSSTASPMSGKTVTKYQKCVLTIDQEPAFTGSATSTVTAGTKLPGKIAVGGNGGYPWVATVTGSGDLPTGMTGTDHNGRNFAYNINGKPATGTAGDYRVTVTADNGAGSSVTEGYVVVDVTPHVTQAATTLTLTASPTTTFGSSTTIVATVGGGSSPGGFVQFDVAGSDAPVTVAVGEDEQATFTTPSTLNAGTYPITATYTGDPRNSLSTATTTLTVGPAPTTLSVSPAVASAGYGSSAQLTATVTSSAGTPEGEVTFKVDGNTYPVDVNGSGQATFTTPTTLTADGGPYLVQAAFIPYTNAPINWSPSTAPTVTLDVGPVTVSAEVGDARGSMQSISSSGTTVSVNPAGTNVVAASFNCEGTPVVPTSVTVDVTSTTGDLDDTAALDLTPSSVSEPSTDSDTGTSDFHWTIAPGSLTSLGVTSATVTISSVGSTALSPASITFTLDW